MSGTRIACRPIGIICSKHTLTEKAPSQPGYVRGCEGTIKEFLAFADGLRGLEGFSYLFLLYHFDRAAPAELTVRPFMQDVKRGLFATRAPCHHNPIELSIVELLRRVGNVLYINGTEMLDGAPLLDIKPYTGRFDRIETTRNGWLDEVDEDEAQRQGRGGYGHP